MIQAIPYILTNGYEPYKKFLLRDFDEKYFDLNNVQIRLASDSEITVNGLIHKLPLYVRTVNDFVNNVWQINVKMYWNEEVEAMFEPKTILETSEIKLHYWNLLHGIEKSHELL